MPSHVQCNSSAYKEGRVGGSDSGGEGEKSTNTGNNIRAPDDITAPSATKERLDVDDRSSSDEGDECRNKSDNDGEADGDGDGDDDLQRQDASVDDLMNFWSAIASSSPSSSDDNLDISHKGSDEWEGWVSSTQQQVGLRVCFV